MVIKRLFLFLSFALATALCGCGGSTFNLTGSGLAQGSSVTIVWGTPPPQYVAVGSTQIQLYAVVSNDPMNYGVDWLVTCAAVASAAEPNPCGTLSLGSTSGVTAIHSASGSGPDGIVSYTAPAALPPGLTGNQLVVNIIAYATADRTKNVPGTINVIALLAIVTNSLPGGIYGTAYNSTTLMANGGVPPYSWSATNLPPGLTLSSNGVLSGTPTSTGSFSPVFAVTDSTLHTIQQNLSLGIAPKVLTITGLTANSRSYTGTTAATLSGTPVLSGVVSGDSVSLTGTAVASFASAGVGTNIPVTVTGYSLSGTSAGNYTLSEPTGLTASITPAPLTVTADNKTMVQGAPLPAFTASYSGFVPGETAAVLTGAPAFSCTASGAACSSSSSPGTYPITVTQGTLAAANYSFTFVNGTLTITASGTATHFSLVAPNEVTAGSPFSFQVTAQDANNNTVISYSGTVQFAITNPDPQAVLPANSTLTNGTGTFNATLYALGTQTLTATDITTGTPTSGITGTSNSIAVVAVASYTVSGQVTVQVPTPGAPLASPPTTALGLQGVTLSLGGGLTATTDVNGNYTISNVLAGSYTLTPSGGVPAGDSVVFYPPSQSITVTSNNLSGQNFGAQPGYNVTGTFSYKGKQSKGGQAFIKLQAPDGPVCSNCPTQGTSVELTSQGSSTTVTKAFTIHGVPPGTYTGVAWYDIYGFGAQDTITGVGNINYPSATPFTVTVTSGDVAAGTVAMSDPATYGNVSPASPDKPLTAIISQIDDGLIIKYPSVLVNGVEQASGYNVNWSSVSPTDCQAGPTTTSGGQLSVARNTTLYEESGNVLILDGDNTNGLFYKESPVAKKPADGQLWFFCMQGVNGNGVGGTFYNFACSPSAPSCTGNTGYGQLTLAAAPASSPAGTSTVTMNVTIPGFTPYTGNGVNVNGPLYAGCYDPSTGGFYVTSVQAATLTGPDGQPGSTTSISVFSVPNTANCTPFAGLNNDNDGLLVPTTPFATTASVSYAATGDLFNLGRGPFPTPGAVPPLQTTPPAPISSTTTFNVDLTPFSENSYPTLTTEAFAAYTDQNSVAQPQSYAVNLNVTPFLASPATVELQTPSPKVNSLMDFAASKDDNFSMSLSTGPLALQPAVGDSYNLLSTSENTALAPDMWGSASTTCTSTPCPLTVTSVNTAFPTGLSATASTTPTFSWSGTGPFLFTVTDTSGNVLWQLPKTLPTYYPLTVTTITWPTDPTGAGNNVPAYITLTAGNTYVYSVTTFDANGNRATQRATFVP